MVFITPPIPPADVISLGVYHPWHGGNNPAFDAFSSLVLSLKKQETRGLNYFLAQLAPLFRDGIAIAVVPSHDPANTTSGMKTLAKHLINNTARIDAVDCLQRTVKVVKSATGGDRSIQKHLGSIQVNQPELIRGQTVLLLDDVTTSHNSLQACRSLLLDAGAASVQGYALGQTQ
ncbi:ComF family protein [Hymenobacter sp. APR13]|uniref:ComF family protein n=1 Tax=Hymenobacter sp. APR13 TaxID=1356852 RepID=UPI0012E03807|nr:phosphoribosyltransferase [Hymenobacter sp. APR13]